MIPREHEFVEHMENEKTRWTVCPLTEQLKARAKALGLWNLFIPQHLDPEARWGRGLTNVEYAHICELMGKSTFAPEVSILGSCRALFN